MSCHKFAEYWLLVLFVLLSLAFASCVLADSPWPPKTYKQITPGNKFAFVMISYRPVEEEYHDTDWDPLPARLELRRVYKQNGMYRNDGSLDPLWTVDWHANRVELTSDGVHLVRHGPWALGPQGAWGPALKQEALSFFANGQLLRSYQIGELVDDPTYLRRSVSHFEWDEYQEERLDHRQMLYTLRTADGNWYVFDLRTGIIVSKTRRLAFAWWLAIGVMIYLGCCVLAIRTRQRFAGRRSDSVWVQRSH